MASTNCSANNLHEDIQTTREKHGRSVYWSQRRWSGGACPCPSRPHPMGDWGERHDACCLLIDPRKLQSEIRFFFFPHRISHAAAFACGRGSLSRASARHPTAARDATWPHLHLLHRSIPRSARERERRPTGTYVVLAMLPSVRGQHRVPCAYRLQRTWVVAWLDVVVLTALRLRRRASSPPSDTTKIRGVEFACRRAHCAPGADRGGGPRAVNSPGSE